MVSYRRHARDSTMRYVSAMVYFAGEDTVLKRYKERVCSLFPATYTEYNNLCKKHRNEQDSLVKQHDIICKLMKKRLRSKSSARLPSYYVYKNLRANGLSDYIIILSLMLNLDMECYGFIKW